MEESAHGLEQNVEPGPERYFCDKIILQIVKNVQKARSHDGKREQLLRNMWTMHIVAVAFQWIHTQEAVNEHVIEMDSGQLCESDFGAHVGRDEADAVQPPQEDWCSDALEAGTVKQRCRFVEHRHSLSAKARDRHGVPRHCSQQLGSVRWNTNAVLAPLHSTDYMANLSHVNSQISSQ